MLLVREFLVHLRHEQQHIQHGCKQKWAIQCTPSNDDLAHDTGNYRLQLSVFVSSVYIFVSELAVHVTALCELTCCMWKSQQVTCNLLWAMPYHPILFDRLMQERCNSSVLAMELHLSCIDPSFWWHRHARWSFIHVHDHVVLVAKPLWWFVVFLFWIIHHYLPAAMSVM